MTLTDSSPVERRIAVVDLPRESSVDRALPKGVFMKVLKDGMESYSWKAWARGGEIRKQGYDCKSPEEAEYRRRVWIQGHHWMGMPEDLTDHFGFVYQMEYIPTGQLYIGSKQLYFWQGPRGGYKCTDPSDEWFDPSLWKHSDWPLYTSSSLPLKRLVGDTPWAFRYRVLSMATSKLELHLMEIKEQVDRDVLNAEFNGEYLYLNENILGVEFRPPVPRDRLRVTMDETAMKVRDYYLRPTVCESCNTVIPYGQPNCPNLPLFGNGSCNDQS